jgi:type IV pilus assembly protein PilB
MALKRERMKLGDLLVKQNVLSEADLMKALSLQKGSGKKIGEVLVDEGFITRR